MGKTNEDILSMTIATVFVGNYIPSTYAVFGETKQKE